MKPRLSNTCSPRLHSSHALKSPSINNKLNQPHTHHSLCVPCAQQLDLRRMQQPQFSGYTRRRLQRQQQCSFSMCASTSKSLSAPPSSYFPSFPASLDELAREMAGALGDAARASRCTLHTTLRLHMLLGLHTCDSVMLCSERWMLDKWMASVCSGANGLCTSCTNTGPCKPTRAWQLPARTFTRG